MKWVALAVLALFLGFAFWFVVRQGTLLREFWLFLKAEKAWWLAPIVLVLLLVGVLLVAGNVAPWLPFIYPIF